QGTRAPPAVKAARAGRRARRRAARAAQRVTATAVRRVSGERTPPAGRQARTSAAAGATEGPTAVQAEVSTPTLERTSPTRRQHVRRWESRVPVAVFEQSTSTGRTSRASG